MKRKSYLTVIAFGICLLSLSQVQAETQWSCGSHKWVTPPTLKKGVFKSTLTAECLLSGGDEKTLSTLAQFLKNDIETSGKLQIHQGPQEASYDGLPALKYEVTDDLKAEGSPAIIRQELLFATDQKTRLIYKTESTHVQGKGMAGYLKKVDLLAEVESTSTPGSYRFRMTNFIQVERPWYALALIFEPIAKDTAIEKFTRVKNGLITYLAPHFK